MVKAVAEQVVAGGRRTVPGWRVEHVGLAGGVRGHLVAGERLMRLRDILADKGSTVHTVGLHDNLGTVVDRMVDLRCGSLVVVEGEQVVGIITERDILRVSAARLGSLDGLRVSDHMSRDLVAGHPDDLISDVMGVLTHRRVRHLPVLESGRLVGIISIGDVVKAQHDALTIENHYLRTYLAG